MLHGRARPYALSVGLVFMLGACATTGAPEARGPCEVRRLANITGDVQARKIAVRAYLERCGLDDAIALTQDLVAFRTVSARGLAADNPEFGRMAGFLRAWSRDYGLEFSTYPSEEPDAVWEIALGRGPKKLGYLMHADVVPVTELDAPAPETDEVPEGWSRPPFAATVEDGRLYGRGTEDDKAPIAAVLVVLRALSAAGLEPSGRVLAILGTGEESHWSGMRHYAQTSTRPEHVVSIDAEYPVVVAESGFVAWKLALPIEEHIYDQSTDFPSVEYLRAGQFLTQVPGEATMHLRAPRGTSPDAYVETVSHVAESETQRLGADYSASVRLGGDRIVVRAFGKAVHSSTADDGHNALWLLANIARALDVAPNARGRMLDLIADRFAEDHWGEKLGMAHAHPLMGPLLVIPTVLRDENGAVELSVNMRRPAGPSSEEFGGMLTKALEELQSVAPGLEERERYVSDVALAETHGHLVPTLVDVFRSATGMTDAEPMSIRGGTYARLFPGAVSFGPSMPEATYSGHGPDENIRLDVLRNTVEMIFEATVRLVDFEGDRTDSP